MSRTKVALVRVHSAQEPGHFWWKDHNLCDFVIWAEDQRAIDQKMPKGMCIVRKDERRVHELLNPSCDKKKLGLRGGFLPLDILEIREIYHGSEWRWLKERNP